MIFESNTEIVIYKNYCNKIRLFNGSHLVRLHYVKLSAFFPAPLDTYFATATDSCPFPDGVYQATYSESSGTRDRCDGVSSSTATVNGVTITLDTCSNANSFSK